MKRPRGILLCGVLFVVLTLCAENALAGTLSFQREEEGYLFDAEDIDLILIDPLSENRFTFFEDTGRIAFDDVDSAKFEDVLAEQLSVTNRLHMSGANPATYSGNTAQLSDSSFFFRNMHAGGADLPRVFLGNWTVQHEILSNLILPLSIENGGTSAVEIEGAAVNFQLGSMAFEEMFDSYAFLGVLPLSKGGTSATEIEGIAMNLQLGSLAVEDSISPLLITGEISVPHGGTGAGEIETARAHFLLGSMAVEDLSSEREFGDVLPISKGGTGASDIEIARNNLQLGALAAEDFVDIHLLRDAVPIRAGGTGAADIETVGINLQLGSVAYQDSFGINDLYGTVSIVQ